MSGVNKHIHLSIAELKQYIAAEYELSNHDKEQIELELQVCDTCSERYVELLEALTNPVLHQQSEKQWEKLIAKIEQQKAQQAKAAPVKKKWYERSSVQFVAAASITGLLFVSGFISVFANYMVQEESKGMKSEWLEVQSSTPNLEQYEWAQQLQEQYEKLLNTNLFEREE